MRKVLTFAAVCAVASVVTTIGIHAVIKGPSTFEESLVVYKSTPYLLGKWWVVAHCFFVIGSTYGLYSFLRQKKVPFADLGFFFYCCFGIFEITRMLLVMHYLGGLRDSYVNTEEAAVRQIIRVDMNSFVGIGNALFTGFMIFIAFGNLFFGVSSILSREKQIRHLGAALLIWSFALMIVLVNESIQNPVVENVTHYFNMIGQPAIRLMLAFSLFRILSIRNNRLEVSKAMP